MAEKKFNKKLRTISRKRNFLRGYLMFIRVENPLFDEFSRELDFCNEILMEARREDPYFDADF